jgi:hypothetical protein
MSGKSLIYSNQLIYHLLMRVLYGLNFKDRYRAIAEIVPNEASVVEVCCGDCYLYRKYLKFKNIDYLGLDINPIFIHFATQKHINAMLFDLNKGVLPKADIVILQAGLYQFIPKHKEIVDKLLSAALQTLIIAEPIKNLSESQNPIISFIAKRAANPGTGHAEMRFNEKTIMEFFKSYGDHTEKIFKIEGGREIVGIFGHTCTSELR